ncbi:MAG: PGPGW domain-containing protein [Deferribacterota bacterium]|nr:PGPGW domain-containing protein [Deferribacterota bacterium]
MQEIFNFNNLIQLIDKIASFLMKKEIFLPLIALSLITFLISLFLVPYIIINIPEDYFLHDKRRYSRSFKHILFRIVKNFFGIILVIMGLVMLFTPGQGILFIFIGFMLINFPGKYRLEKRLIKNKKIYIIINNIRKKYNKKPIIINSD